MADNDYTSSLNELLGNLSRPTQTPQSPEEDIKNLYEKDMQDAPSGLGGLIENSIQTSGVDDVAFDQYSQGVAAGQMGDTMYAGLDAERYGPAPEQQIMDPNAMIGSTGERVERGLKAGWGDLVSGTGDAIDFVSALVSPGEGDLTTSVGSYLKKVGTEYQQENALVLSEDLQDITWDDMFKQEFWSSKISRLVPYAASFMIPYGGGSMAAGRLLGRFGPTALKMASQTGKMGKMAKGANLTGAGTKAFKGDVGKGVLGKLGLDLGKAGIKPTKLLRDVSGYIGGGATANLFEGAYLAGEAYQEMANDVDDNGNPLFTPEEAASHAAGVMKDNAKWMGVDMLQYGILFGGAGRSIMGKVLRNPVTKTPYAENMKGLSGWLVRRAADTPAALTYASVEAITEAYQEVYQEWAKYKNIQEAKNLGYEPMTTWLKEAPFGEDRPELRDIFWSSFGLGGSMGGARGYFDASAERKYLTDKKIDSYNNVIDMLSENEGNRSVDQNLVYEKALDNLVASNIWNYSGDGSAAMSIVDNLVKDNKITEEQGAEYKSRIELAERDYETHHINSSLTEAGAEKAFNLEMVKTRVEGQIASETATYNETVKKQKSIFKDDKTRLDAKLEVLKKKHEESLEIHNNDLAKINKGIQNIYAAKVDEAPVAKSTGKRDARFKEKGLTKDEFETFTQEGEKGKTEREKAEAEAKAEEKTGIFETVKDLGGKAVKGVKSLFGKAKDKAQSPETKEAIKKVKDYTKNEITPTAKEYLVKLLEAGKIAATTVATIAGTGINKIINRGDVDKAVKKAERAKTKEKAKEDIITPEVIKDSKKSKYAKTEEMQNKGKPIRQSTDAVTVDGIDYRFKIEEFEDGTVLYNVSEIASDDKGGMPIRSLTEKEYKSLVEKSDKDVKKKDLTEITDEIYNEFVDKGTVPQGVINLIANKIKNNQELSDKEQAVRQSKSKEVESLLRDTKVVPKTKEYKTTEESLEKGPRQIKKADIQKGTGSNYFIKTPEGETIQYRDFEGVSDKYVLDEDANLELRLKKPVKGQEGVVEVDGKLYFQFDNNLYETEIEVVVNNEVVGKVAQQDYRAEGPTKKAKKKDTRKIDQLIGAVKETKEKIKKYLTRTQKEIPDYEPTTLNIRPLYKYGSGVIASSIVRDIVDKKFPGAKGVLAYEKLLTDFGEEASSLAIGSTVFINIDSVAQTDIIHEAGHIFYSLMEDTPLMKRIKKLLPKSELYQRTKREYPELTLMKFKDLNMTLGLIYREIFKNTSKEYDSFPDIVDIVNNIAAAEKAEDSTRVNELFVSLRTQLKINGGKDVRVDQQKHLLEETFTRTLESFSYGTVDAVVKDSATQKQLEKDLIEFYKESKKLATEEEARKLLDLTVDNIAGLDLEAAIKTILLNFNSAGRTVPYMMNSAYGPIGKANKKILSNTASYSAVSYYISENIQLKNNEDIVKKVMQGIADDSALTVKSKDIQDLNQYIHSVIIQLKDNNNLKKADKILDAKLSEIGLRNKHQEGDNVQAVSEGHTRELDKERVLPTTTTNFIKKIVEYYNRDKDEKSIIKSKKILSAIMSLAKETKNNPYDFIIKIRKSLNPDIQAMVMTMDEIYAQVGSKKDEQKLTNPKRYTNAKLVELKGPIEGINIEVLAHNVLSIGDNGERSWYRNLSTSKTIEKKVLDSILKGLEKNTQKEKEIAEVYNNLFDDSNYLQSIKDKKKVFKRNDLTARNESAKRILNILFDLESGEFINKDILLNNQIMFRGKKQLIHNILFDYDKKKISYIEKATGKTKYRKDLVLILKNENLFTVYNANDKKFTHNSNGFKSTGVFRGSQIEIRDIVTTGLVMSRAENYITMIDNVEQDGVSVLNKDNGFWSSTKNVFEIANSGIKFGEKDLINPDHNIFVAIAQLQGKEEGVNNLNPFNITVHSGMKRYFEKEAYGLKNKESLARKANDVNPNELTVGDFFMFLSRYNQGKQNNQKTIYYDQPVAVFSDKSRRYYIESIIAHDAKSRKALLSRIEKNPAYKDRYKGKKDELGARVFPYDIKGNKLVGKDMTLLVNSWQAYIQKNKELFKNNTDLNKILDDKRRLSREAIESFLISTIANKFMAQQLFVHDHRQSENEIDYIKRAAGAIAGHTVLDRNTSVEFFVTNDYYVAKDDYVSEDGKRIFTKEEAKERFGETWEKEVAVENDAMGYVLPDQAELITAKYGDAQKVGNVFKFVYHYTEREGPLKDRTTYMKFAVHTLTPEMEATSLYLKNLGDSLRTRTFEVGLMSKSRGNLVIGASQSAAKLYAGEQQYIHDITSIDNIGGMMMKQDEIYADETGYRGLSGEGFGIQLELDKQTDERFFPSQLFYNLLTNITQENKEQVTRMLELRKNVMEDNNKNRNSSIIGIRNNKDILKERDSFKSSVTADIYDVLVESSYDNLHPMYPYLNASHNAVATGRITHKGTKMYIKGSIGYQSSSIGMGLKSYQKGLYKGTPLSSTLKKALAKNEDIVVSEAIVPGYLKDQGIKKGDLFIGTRVPAHGKVSSSVFIVKDFHKQIKGTPTSNVTIPAWVSKYWGADLDGDSVHMNFRYTPEEVTKDSWKAQSNEFFDLYVDLVSQEDRQREITADINFVPDAENALDNIAEVYGAKDKVMDSQLTPMGDSQMFEDNVPAKQLVGIIASLMRTFNLFSNSEDKLPIAISIKNKEGVVENDKFFDNADLENGVGNWYGVAQLLNIALDNAKYGYAGQLGMNMESIFSYVLLRRLGYSLNDLGVMFNAPLVKEYLEYKRSRSKNYISKDSDIMDMFADKNDEFENQFETFSKKKGLGIDLSSTIKNKRVDIDLTNIKNPKQQKEVLKLLYILDSYNKNIVKPFSKAFTVHQTIEKNPLELSKINKDIKEIVSTPLNLITKWGKESLMYELQEETKSNFILKHATDLFDTSLERSNQTDIRYSNYIKDILENPSSLKVLKKLGESKSEVINQVIANNIREQSGLINEVIDKPELIKEFELMQSRDKKKENRFLNNIIQVSEDRKNIVINREAITDFTSYRTINNIKDEFSKLNDTEKDLIFQIEYLFNLFGYKGGAGKATSFVPFFDNEYVDKINTGMNKVIEHNKEGYNVDFDKGSTPGELLDAIEDVEKRKAGIDNWSVKKKRDNSAKANNSFEVTIKKAKKVITPDTSYSNDYLGDGVKYMDFPKWAADKGIDINKIEEGSNTFQILYNNYTKYKDHLKQVREFEATLKRKPLSKYTIEGLYDMAKKYRKMDNSATKGIAYRLEKEIGQKIFEKQSEYLRDVGASKGYTYNIPGEEGTPQDDLTGFQAWLGSNNMTSKRPEIQYLINEAQTQYRKYLRSFKEHKNLIEEKNRALIRSKMKGLSILEKVRKGFDTNARYQYIYGNISTVENGNVRLYTPEEIVENGVDLTKQEEEYYIRYKAVAEILLGSEDGKTIVPGMQMGNLENMSRSGLFGLYNTTIDSYDYNRVKVYGRDKSGDRVLKTFYEWKYDVYKGRTRKLKLDSGKEIFELDKLRVIAKQQKAKGQHHDNTPIMLSDVEYDALVNNGAMLKRMVGFDKVSDIDAELIQEYERRQGVKAQNITYDINSSLLEYARSSIFMNGEGKYKMEDDVIKEREDRFTGMGDLAILTDSIIGFNKNLDNKNAVQYLTKWWKEGFLEKKQQVGIFGKTGDKVIDKFVQLTSLRLLGFNIGVGFGNLLAGKYQELRKRGGSQFIKGEERFWKDSKQTKDILKKYRIVEYSFDEFIHLSERKGYWGDLERASYFFMDRTENYIQGAAFLGMLTDKEYRTGEISEERVMYINHKISTLHGEGYSALDASMLSMYSYGRALLQFKKWFITLFQDRFKAEDIDRFGEVNIGSYRATSDFARNLFRKFWSGELKAKDIIEEYNKSSDIRKKELRAYINGVGIGITLLSLIAIMEDDDDADTETLRALKKFSHDVFVTTDLDRFVNYTLVPASYGTFKNANKIISESVRGDKIQRTGPYGEKGDSQAFKTLTTKLMPYSELNKDRLNLQYTGASEKKETSSLIR